MILSEWTLIILLQNKIGLFVKLVSGICETWKNCRKVEELSRKLTEYQNTIMGLRARIQELQNKINCMNDLRDFKDVESVRSGQSHAEPQQSAARFGISTPHPQESNLLVSNVSEHTSPHVMSESQTPAQDQRCQSGPSARNSFDCSEGGFSKNYGADQQRLQISDPHFDKFPTPATSACWKIRFKTEVVCTCSQFPTEAMLWIKRSGDG